MDPKCNHQGLVKGRQGCQSERVMVMGAERERRGVILGAEAGGSPFEDGGRATS